jgi:hypothetical protein
MGLVVYGLELVTAYRVELEEKGLQYSSRRRIGVAEGQVLT